MPVHDPSSESFDWETIFESSDRCGETVARTCLFGQRRISQFSYYNMSAYNVYYVKCNVVLNNVIFDSCLFPHQHYDRHSFHARECCAIRQNVRGEWLRLNEARRLMLNEHYDVTTAAYAVGYESLSHFSREYTRIFGESPKRDITELRKSAGKL